MLNLIQLELKKSKINGYLYAFVISTIAVCALVTAIIGIETSEVLTLPISDIFIAMLGSIFLIIEGTMLAGIVIDEYEDKTISLMYQYPIPRKKILMAKLLLIYGVTFVCMFLAHVFLYGFLYGVTHYVAYFAELGLVMGDFGEQLKRYVVISLYYPIVGFIPLLVGMKMKTSRATIITSVIMVVIIGSNNSGSNSIISFALTGALLTVIGLSITFFSLRKVNTEDLL